MRRVKLAPGNNACEIHALHRIMLSFTLVSWWALLLHISKQRLVHKCGPIHFATSAKIFAEKNMLFQMKCKEWEVKETIRT